MLKEGTNAYPEMAVIQVLTIKVTVLPLTYAVYPWSEYCECAMMQK